MGALISGLFGGVTGYIYAAIGVLFLVMGGTCYFLYTQNESLNKKIEAVDIQSKQYQAQVNSLTTDLKNIKSLQDTFNKNMNDIQAQTNNLATFFTKHDLQKDASKKPTLIEKDINTKFDAFFNSLKEVTK